MSNILPIDQPLHRADAGDGKQAVKNADLLGKVGENVRLARTERRVSRRALSTASGVSQRYLAELEAGRSNISIGLLQAIADALGTTIAELAGDMATRPLPGDADLASAFNTADIAVRQQILELLDIASPPKNCLKIALVGLRGAGKSTIGRMAAKQLGMGFVEINDEIETICGMAIDEVIALYGQEGYRQLERQALERVLEFEKPLVIAVAGGIVCEPDTYEKLLRTCRTIWLKAMPEEHMARVRAQGDERPMAGNPAAMDDLRAILTGREQHYARANAVVDTSAMGLERTLGETVRLIQAFAVKSRG